MSGPFRERRYSPRAMIAFDRAAQWNAKRGVEIPDINFGAYRENWLQAIEQACADAVEAYKRELPRDPPPRWPCGEHPTIVWSAYDARLPCPWPGCGTSADQRHYVLVDRLDPPVIAFTDDALAAPMRMRQRHYRRDGLTVAGTKKWPTVYLWIEEV